jgi:hypothetical protein
MVVDENWLWPFHMLKSNKRSTICTEQNTSCWTDSRSAGKNSRSLSKCSKFFHCLHKRLQYPFRTQELCHAIRKYPLLRTWYVVLTSKKLYRPNDNNNKCNNNTYNTNWWRPNHGAALPCTITHRQLLTLQDKSSYGTNRQLLGNGKNYIASCCCDVLSMLTCLYYAPGGHFSNYVARHR